MRDEATRQTPGESYPVSPRNRVRRAHERGSYDHAAVHAVLDAGMMAHIAYVIDGQPYCTPTIHWREGNRLYWHGSSASRMLRQQAGGMAVCVTVSHLDGLVLARSGFHHSLNYRSAICFGTARIVEDPVEMQQALGRMIERFYPGRTAELRADELQELKATKVIVMEIEEASAKVRAAGVNDDAADLALPIWAGVIPVTTVLGEPQASADLPSGTAFPAHLARFQPGRALDECLLETQALYEAAEAG